MSSRYITRHLEDVLGYDKFSGSKSKKTMNHVHIKWKAVVGIIVVGFLLVCVAYKLVFPNRPCSKDTYWAEYKDLNNYCNYPFLAVDGLEGEVLPTTLHGPKLVSVHVVVRHGDRSPLHQIPGVNNLPMSCHYTPRLASESLAGGGGPVKYDEFLTRMNERGNRKLNLTYAGLALYPDDVECRSGSLTPSGAMQHILNGAFMRSVYVTKHELLNADITKASEQILIRGTTISRTFHSAVAFMHGFQPELDMASFQNVETADNNTMCVSQTGHRCSCTVIQRQYLDSFASSFGQHSEALRRLPELRRVALRLGVDIAKLPRLTHIFDVAMTHYCHGALPECFDTSFSYDIFGAIDEAGRLAINDRRYRRLARLKSQPLLYEMAHRMKAQLGAGNHSATGRQLPVFVLYSGHDSTVEPLAAALGMSNGSWPKYASRIVLELYRPSDELTGSISSASIRVLFDGRVVTQHLSFCRNRLVDTAHGLCPLKYFMEFVEEEEFNGGLGKSGYYYACEKGLSR